MMPKICFYGILPLFFIEGLIVKLTFIEYVLYLYVHSNYIVVVVGKFISWEYPEYVIVYTTQRSTNREEQ